MILRSIYRYPVKGFSPESPPSIELSCGRVLPYDRRWSLAFGGSETVIDVEQPESWVGKRNLLSLARESRGAQLRTEFDEANLKLIIKRNERIVAQGSLNSSSGRHVIESFLDSFYAGTPFCHFRILEAAAEGKGGGFTDFAESHVSFINANTVKDIERVVGRPLDPIRFRGNFLFEAPAWEERKWAGKQKLRIGSAEFLCSEEIERCQATNVSPTSGEEDLNIPLSLRRGFGHIICGVYATVIKDGSVSAGDELELLN